MKGKACCLLIGSDNFPLFILSKDGENPNKLDWLFSETSFFLVSTALPRASSDLCIYTLLLSQPVVWKTWDANFYLTRIFCRPWRQAYSFLVWRFWPILVAGMLNTDKEKIKSQHPSGLGISPFLSPAFTAWERLSVTYSIPSFPFYLTKSTCFGEMQRHAQLKDCIS